MNLAEIIEQKKKILLRLLVYKKTMALMKEILIIWHQIKNQKKINQITQTNNLKKDKVQLQDILGIKMKLLMDKINHI